VILQDEVNLGEGHFVPGCQGLGSDSEEKFGGDTLPISLSGPRWLHSARERRNYVILQFTAKSQEKPTLCLLKWEIQFKRW
jgi:hypothetical protein